MLNPPSFSPPVDDDDDDDVDFFGDGCHDDGYLRSSAIFCCQ
jgi:hypothetical protein